MKNYFLIICLTCSVFSSCRKNNDQKTEKMVSIQEQNLRTIDSKEKTKVVDGFLFIDISKIYHNDGKVNILNQKGDVFISIVNQLISIDSKDFDIIDQEHLYRDSLKIESFDPEYGLFIMKSKSANENGFYEVEINNKTYKISLDYSDVLRFKTIERYILESYPNPTNENPLRKKPSAESDIILNFNNHTYLSIEIDGDWLKIKDDKDCYYGEEPSKEDIIGWVRWRSKGEIILDIRHSC